MLIRNTLITTLVAVIAFAFLIGCSGSGNPLAPGTEITKQESGSANNTHLWGSWNVKLDPATNTAEILPIRGPSFTADVTQFLQPPIASKHLMAIEISPDTDWMTGYVKVDVILTHPFPGLDMYTGFDVMGVCVGNGSINGLVDSDILYAGPEDLRVLNADGLTRWYNPGEFTTYETLFGFTMGKLGTPKYEWTGTLNGYKYFCDEIETDITATAFFADPACPNPRGYFSAGQANRRTYELQFPLEGDFPVYDFQYAIVASWELPTEDPVQVPESFSLSANCQEPYVISTADQSDMYYSGGSYGGSLILDVRVFDHQSVLHDPVSVHDEIGAIYLETPSGLITSGGLATFTDASLDAALIGEDEISATYRLEVGSVHPAAAGPVDVLVAVQNADPGTYDSGYPGFDFPDGSLCAYVMAEATVSSDVSPTVLAIDPPEGTINTTLTGVEVTGTDFIVGSSTVKLIKNDDPLVTIDMENLTYAPDGTMITGDLNLSSSNGAEVGVYDVEVTNPGPLTGVLEDGFEVLDSGYPYWWENHMYDTSHIGRNPTATSPDPKDWQLMWSVPAPQTYKNLTPLVAEDKIFFLSYTGYYDYSLSARVYCYDLNTGVQKWNARVNYSLTSPRINAGFGYWSDGTNEYLVAAVDQIYCFDANSSGTNPPALWTYDDNSPNDAYWIGSQMITYDGKVLAKCQNQTSLHILDITDGSLIHEVTLPAGGEAGVAAKDGKAYTINGHYFSCVDLASGTVDWTTDVLYSAGLWVSPCLEDDKAYLTTNSAHVICVATADQGSYSAGDIIWDHYYGGTFSAGGVAKYESDVFVSNVYSGQRIYAITDNGSTASTKWISSVTGYWDSTPSVIVTPTNDAYVAIPERYTGTIYFFDTDDGSVYHTISTGDQYRTGLSFVGDYMIGVGASTLKVWYVP